MNSCSEALQAVQSQRGAFSPHFPGSVLLRKGPKDWSGTCPRGQPPRRATPQAEVTRCPERCARLPCSGWLWYDSSLFFFYFCHALLSPLVPAPVWPLDLVSRGSSAASSEFTCKSLHSLSTLLAFCEKCLSQLSPFVHDLGSRFPVVMRAGRPAEARGPNGQIPTQPAPVSRFIAACQAHPPPCRLGLPPWCTG